MTSPRIRIEIVAVTRLPTGLQAGVRHRQISQRFVDGLLACTRDHPLKRHLPFVLTLSIWSDEMTGLFINGVRG